MEQTKPKYAIGDRVRFVGSDEFYHGMVVTITGVAYDEHFKMHYYSHDLSGRDFWEHALELVERKAE